MSVHYKFKSALEYDTVTFDGLHISVKDLKNAILQQKRIGKSTDFDLQVTNAQTKEVYEDENALIQKNASLLIARIPVIPQKNKSWEGYGGDNTPPQTKLDEGGPVAKEVDLSSLDAPEDDKIRAMMSQSTQDYDPSNYIKLRGANQVGAVPPNYKCYKCHQGGHWIKDCTFALGAEPVEIKKSTGIPRSFMIAVEGPKVPGAMMTPNGQFAVPLVDHQAYNQKPAPAIAQTPKTDIPEDLVCNICLDLLTDAVMIPCCGNSFCDECIRGVLLESEDHECPDCHEKDISPDTLIPNRFLRTSVSNFKNTTGYVKAPSQRPPKAEVAAILKEEPALKPEIEQEKHTVISEADSTELIKSQNTDNIKKNENESIDGPPGVSPKNSPRDHRKYRDLSPRSPRERRIRRKSRSLSRSISPRRSPRRRRSRSRSNSRSRDRRSGTPTVDEPLASNTFPSNYATSTIGTVGPIPGHPPPIPGNFPAPLGTFSAQGPPPSYRYPPPAGAAPYMPPGPYNIPPRGMFDVTRPPIGGPPPNFQSFPPRNHRDYNRRMLDRAPPGVIDDPLAAFNRLLREKDEQKRRAKQRGFRRSYSRSRSRSRSYSRSPIRRRSRSPRASRRSRSRSRSFSLSRSRSRSFSGSLRGSPHRQLSPARRSPPPSAPRRGSRYRSPLRSPPRSRIRDRDYDDDRDYDRHDRRDNRRGRERRSPRDRDRDRDRYYDNYDDKRGGGPRGHQGHQWNQPRSDNYFPQAPQPLQSGYQPNRFGQPRDFGPPAPPPFIHKDPPPFNQPLPQTIHSIQPQRQYQDIAPPGVDDDIAPPGVEEYNKPVEKKEIIKKEEKPDKRKESSDRKRRHDKRSRTPDNKRKSRSKDREKDSPDKHKRRRRESSDKEDRKKEHSDDEKSKKNKEKKKHKDKKESSEKKKKRDKKEKHKKDKESKEKKSKEEFRQVIPKHTDDEEEDEAGEKKDKKHGSDKKRSEKEKHKKVEKQKDINVKEKNQQETVRETFQNKDTVNEDETLNINTNSKEQVDVDDNKTVEKKESVKTELYDDLLTDIDSNVLENYRKINDGSPFEGREDGGVNKPPPEEEEEEEETEITEDGEIKDFDEEKDVLELHSNDIDLKTEIDKSDILAPVPEKSKWEVEDDGAPGTSPNDNDTIDVIVDKNGKVTNEVLKRAENAIFAKAINAIRPIEIKKIGTERAKLYSSNDKEPDKAQVSASAKIIEPPPVRLSVKERLGVKIVEENDKVINLSRRSNTVSPFSRRGDLGRNVEKRTDSEDHATKRSRRSRSRRSSRDRQRRRGNDDKSYKRSDHKPNKKSEKPKKEEDEKKSKRKRSRTRSQSKDKLKKKERKPKKEKTKKKDEEQQEKNDDNQKDQTPSLTSTKRKATIDEANFEPDYDESHSDDDEEKKIKRKTSKKESDRSSSSESGSSSSSQEERKKKKRKKHRKKKKKESSTESSSEESDSSESDKDRKRKKHKKTKKKKKKSKRKS